MNLKRQVDKFNASITRKAVIRYLTIVMDFSAACLKSDLRPNRAIVMKDKISVSVYYLIVSYKSLLSNNGVNTEVHPRVRRAEPFIQNLDHGHL